MNTDERLLRVMTTVRHGLAEQIFDAIEDEESAQDAQELRREVARLERQCAELCEKRVEVKMKQFPWNFIHEHYFECLRLKTKA
jgi:YesN/AraC family two-component response regulator